MARPRTKRNPKNAGSVYFDNSKQLYVAQVFEGYRENGKPKYRKVRRKAHAEAVQALRELTTEQNLGKPRATGATTVGKWLDRWLEDHVKPNLAPKTYRFYEQQVRIHLKPGLGRFELRKLGPQDVQRFLRGKAMEQNALTGKPQVGPATLDAMRRTLRAACGQAIALGLAVYNPVNAATRVGYKRTEAKHLTPDEALKLMEALKGSPVERLVAFILSTGVRVGEATGLRWSDVDLDRRTVRIAAQLQRVDGALTLRPLKTDKSRRELPLIDRALQAVQDEKARQLLDGFENPLGLVFLNSEGRPFDPRNADSHLKAALQKAGLPPAGMHVLRHTAGTMMLMAGQGLHIVSRALGHSSITLTSNTYGHVLSDPLREALDSIGQTITEAERKRDA